MTTKECSNLYLAFIGKGVYTQNEVLSVVDPAYRPALQQVTNFYYMTFLEYTIPHQTALVELDLIFGDEQIEITFDENKFANFLQDFAAF